MSERPGRAAAERPVVAAFTLSIVSALALAVVYTLGGQPQLEGLALGLSLGGIGVGTVLWAKRFMPTDEVTEERIRLESTEEEVAAFTTVFEGGQENLQRRSLLVKLGLGALGALGVAALFPIRSLGPRPGKGLKTTDFANAPIRVVTEDGQPVRPVDVAPGGLLTVFPQGKVRDGDSPTVLINTGTEGFVPRRGREDWTVAGVVAYSKLCTHTGCPVGLYQSQEQLLLCPCHQSTFDVLDGARPVFGPAARSLPQLPIDVDGEGFIVATGDFSDPVGGGFWDRDTR